MELVDHRLVYLIVETDAYRKHTPGIIPCITLSREILTELDLIKKLEFANYMLVKVESS